MAKLDIPYPPDDLDSLKQKRKTIEAKIKSLETQILEWREKDSVIAAKIFEREDGRILKAAKELMAKDEDVKKAIDHILLKLDIGGVSKAGKRGRPAKTASSQAALLVPEGEQSVSSKTAKAS